MKWRPPGRGRPRWLAAAPILLVTLTAQWHVAHPAPVFRASAVIAMEAPLAESVSSDRPNPATDPRGSLAATAAVVAQGMMSPSGQDQLRGKGVTGTYDLTPRNSGTVQEPYFNLPRIDVSVRAPDPATALRSLDVVVAALKAELTGLQDDVGVEAGDRVTTRYLVPPAADRVFTSKVRGLFAVTVLGYGAALLVPLWIGESGAGRAARRAARLPAASGLAKQSARRPGRESAPTATSWAAPEPPAR